MVRARRRVEGGEAGMSHEQDSDGDATVWAMEVV
jgi:hypothetical protein